MVALVNAATETEPKRRCAVMTEVVGDGMSLSRRVGFTFGIGKDENSIVQNQFLAA